MRYDMGNSLSISLQFVDFFQVLLSPRASARHDGVACTLSDVFLGHSYELNKIVLNINFENDCI